MTIADALTRRHVRTDDFAAVLTTIFARRYTGSFSVHCVDGIPRVIEIPGEQVRLVPAPPTGGLDTPPAMPDAT